MQGPAVPGKINGTALAALLRPRLLGAPASSAPSATQPTNSVVWVDGPDELLVHLDSIATEIVGSTVLVAIDVETDQTGRTPLVVAFAIQTSGSAGLVAATDQLPRGNGVLASRWGAMVRDAAWSALLALATDHATAHGGAARGFTIANGELTLTAGPPVALS
ncbi:MAG TPA: hypothetical protein VK679_05325 [Gemmatimonadaceae bacterium]|nr:hypothetical protein [Gemmatimonadaceae bacterium]